MLNDMTMRRRADRRVPVCGRLVQRPQDAGAADQIATELYLATLNHKHNLAFRPLETALLNGKVDAIYTHSKTWQHLAGGHRQDHGDRGPVAVPGLDAAGRTTSPPSSPAPT